MYGKRYPINKNKPSEDKQPKYWLKHRLFDPEQQPLTPGQMRDAVNVICENVMQSKRGYTYIQFSPKSQAYGDKVYPLYNTAIAIKAVGSDEWAFPYIREDEEINATVTIDSDRELAFLEVSGMGKEAYIVELSDFSMLSVIGKSEDSEYGLFTRYSKESGVFCLQSLVGCPNLNYAELPKSADMNKIPDEDESTPENVRIETEGITADTEFYQENRQICLSDAIEILNAYECKCLELDGKDDIVVSFTFNEIEILNGKLIFTYEQTNADDNFIAFPTTTIIKITPYVFQGVVDGISFYLSNGEEWRAYHYNLVPLAPQSSTSIE